MENTENDNQLPPGDPPPLPPENPPAPEGATVYTPKGMTSFHWNGQTFEVADDGTALVPHAAVPHLQAHGISTSPIPEPSAGRKKGK